MASDPPFEQSYNHLFEALSEDQKAKKVHHETNSFANNEIFELPLIDLNRLSLTKSDQDECKREIADAAKQLGFFQVVNHGVSQEIITRLQSEQAKLFKHPFREKASERLLDSSSGSYHWGTPSATFLMQFSWSEAFHIPLTGLSGLNGFDNVRYFIAKSYPLIFFNLSIYVFAKLGLPIFLMSSAAASCMISIVNLLTDILLFFDLKIFSI